MVERSTDYGKTFTQIGTLPYGGNGNNWSAGRVAGACMVIIDATTVFVAGGAGNSTHNEYFGMYDV